MDHPSKDIYFVDMIFEYEKYASPKTSTCRPAEYILYEESVNTGLSRLFLCLPPALIGNVCTKNMERSYADTKSVKGFLSHVDLLKQPVFRRLENIFYHRTISDSLLAKEEF